MVGAEKKERLMSAECEAQAVHFFRLASDIIARDIGRLKIYVSRVFLVKLQLVYVVDWK